LKKFLQPQMGRYGQREPGLEQAWPTSRMHRVVEAINNRASIRRRSVVQIIGVSAAAATRPNRPSYKRSIAPVPRASFVKQKTTQKSIEGQYHQGAHGSANKTHGSDRGKSLSVHERIDPAANDDPRDAHQQGRHRTAGVPTGHERLSQQSYAGPEPSPEQDQLEPPLHFLAKH
jgi:hypothetical protein